MKSLLIAVACLALTGCDYTVPLVTTPQMDIDKQLIGCWEATQANGQTETLLVLPLGKREYLVSYPAASTNAIFARACLCTCAGKKLVQLEWFGTAQGKLPEDKRVFQYASYATKNDSLQVWMLNTAVVSNSVTTTEALAKAIEANRDNPDLFKSEKMDFWKAAD